MNQVLLVIAVALTVGAVVFGITALINGDDEGLSPAEPEGRAVPLPADRPLVEADLQQVRLDTALRGYRMSQVDAALRRAAYDIGYKDELVRVLQAEVDALREGRFADAEVLRRAREAALAPAAEAEVPGQETAGSADESAEADGTGDATDADGAGAALEGDGAGAAPKSDGAGAAPETDGESASGEQPVSDETAVSGRR